MSIIHYINKKEEKRKGDFSPYILYFIWVEKSYPMFVPPFFLLFTDFAINVITDPIKLPKGRDDGPGPGRFLFSEIPI